MSRRRHLLGGIAALATAPAVALAAPNRDAELIRACARYLELERVMNDPSRPDREEDFDKLPEHPEYLLMLEVMEATEPQTLEGCAALANVALVCDASIQQSPWHDGEGAWIAHKVLRHLAGPAVVREEDRLAAERARSREEADARLYAMPAVRPASEPYLDTRTPEEKLEGARMLLRTAEQMVREAEVAAGAVVA